MDNFVRKNNTFRLYCNSHRRRLKMRFEKWTDSGLGRSKSSVTGPLARLEREAPPPLLLLAPVRDNILLSVCSTTSYSICITNDSCLILQDNLNSSCIFVFSCACSGGHQQSIDEIIGQAPSHVTTVYVGGIPPQLLSDEVLRQNFQHLGTIQETKIFRDKGYGFVKYALESFEF